MSCKGVDIGGINSSFIPPTGLSLLPYGIGTNCSAHWKFEQVAWPHVSGSGDVQVRVYDSQMGLGVILNKGDDDLAHSAQVTACSTSIKLSLKFSGGVIDWILELLKSVLTTQIEKGIDKESCSQLSTLINQNLTLVLQQVDEKIIPYLSPQPPSPAPNVSSDETLNLYKSSVVRIVGYMVHNLFGREGALSLNKIANHFTQNSGNLTITKEILGNFSSFTFPISTIGNVTIDLEDITATGLNTWGDIELFAVSNYSLGFHSELDTLSINATFSINATTNSQGILDGGFLFERGKLVIELERNNLNSTMQVAINQKVLHNLKMTQMADKGCLKDVLSDANLTQLFFNMDVKSLSIIAIDGDLEYDIDLLINNVLALLTSGFGRGIPAFFNSFVAENAQKQANHLFENIMQQDIPCAPPQKEKDTFNLYGTIGSMSGAGLIFLVIALALITHQVRHRKTTKKNAAVMNEDEDESKSLLYSSNSNDYFDPQSPPVVYSDSRNFSESSLGFHPKILGVLRVVIPLLLLLNIALFISSNSSVGASVIMILTAYTPSGADQMKSPSLFTFSLGDTVRDMWKAGVYPLALLIAVFSGAWPYLKLLIMLFCWYTPPHSRVIGGRKSGRKTRETLLMTLDMLGKWSLIDAFVMIIMMVAFHFHMESPVLPDSNPPEYGAVDVFQHPNYGFYTFLIATMLSLILTHVILACHHHVSRVTDSADVSYGRVESSESLCNHIFSSGDDDHDDIASADSEISQAGDRFHFTLFGRILVVVLLLASAGLILYGMIIPSFAFEFKGATGFLLRTLGYETKTSYSVVTLGQAIPKSSQFPNDVGTRLIQGTYFTFTVFMPLAHLSVLLFLWLVPLRPKIQRRVFIVTEIFNAWSALEVFIVSIIAAILEIQQFAQFIVGDKCDEINVLLEKYMSGLLEGDNKCFDVVATLDKGCWTLFGACIIYIFVGTLVMRTTHKAIDEHQNIGRRSIHVGGNSYGIYDYKSSEEKKLKKKKRSCGVSGCFVSLGKMLGILREYIEEPEDS